MKLDKGSKVVIAWADKCYGPGWSNNPVWLIVRDTNGKLEQLCLQPEEQTKEIRILFSTNYESSATMTEIIANLVETSK